MPRNIDLVRLFTAIGERNWEIARVEAEKIARDEEGVGHVRAAEALRSALTPPRHFRGGLSGGPTSTAEHRNEWLLQLEAGPTLESVELTPAQRTFVLALVEEYRARTTLDALGIPLRRRILMQGPPGCGKTLTVRAIARELGLPCFVVRFDALVGAYLGQTSARLREVFRFAEDRPCALLLDEIDAVGRARGRTTDVGELDRVVISLMQQLEHARPAGLVFAASNVAASLDAALVRRFDAVVPFAKPTPPQLIRFAKKIAQRREVALNRGVLEAVRAESSYARVESLVVDEQRRLALQIWRSDS